jgi:hypothetical protein
VTDSKTMLAALSVIAALTFAASTLAACDTSHHDGSQAANRAPTTATKPPSTTVANLPVVACSTTTSGTQTEPDRPPARASVRLPTAVADRLWLYSDGRITVLAPPRWICSSSVGADGSLSMFVVPAGTVSSTNPELDYPGVFVSTDNTGQVFGQALVCGYFPNSAAARVGQLCDRPPKGTKIKPLDSDVVTFRHGPTSGFAIYPDASSATANVDVAKVSCDAGTLCTEILRDALTRLRPA